MSIRVRYAPSPTGDPHVGNIRTAIWTWLHARRYGGDFVLRLEDTDQSRAVEGSLQRIESSLQWLGIDWDEGPNTGGNYGPYVQSERLERYQSAANKLLTDGHAYRCFCTPEDLTAMRKQQREAGEPPGYDGTHRDYDSAQADTRAANGESHVVRFRMPRAGTTTFEDLIRGEITYENRLLDDFVILKSDGFPTYHLAHVIDDHAMAISHVTRGDEWIPSSPRHVCLVEALGYERPTYVHTPIILGPDGGKLSKRHGAKSVLDYADEGYLPEALLNFLTIMGWALDDKTEIMSREELISGFNLADLNPAPATFDNDKLEWMNGVYMRQLPENDLAERFRERLEHDLPASVARPLDQNLIASFTPLIRERVKLLSEVVELTDFFFTDKVPALPANELLGRSFRKQPERAAPALASAANVLESLQDNWYAEPLESALRATAEELDVRAGDLFMVCRVAITGKRVTPPLFETMEIVEAKLCLERIRSAENILRAAHPNEPVSKTE